jgi:thiol-disulfide isomerase/thioredoxin
MVGMKRLLRGVLAAGGLVLVLAGCTSGSSVDNQAGSGLGFQLGDGAVVFNSGHRYAAGDVSGTTLTGQHFSLASLRGKVVVVNFWADWCGPCRGEAQGFNRVARDDASKGVAFLGIDERDALAQGKTFEVAHHVPYPSLFDNTGLLALQFPHAAPAATPTTIVLDRSGKIAAKVSGALDYTHLNSLVNAILREKST